MDATFVERSLCLGDGTSNAVYVRRRRRDVGSTLGMAPGRSFRCDCRDGVFRHQHTLLVNVYRNGARTLECPGLVVIIRTIEDVPSSRYHARAIRLFPHYVALSLTVHRCYIAVLETRCQCKWSDRNSSLRDRERDWNDRARRMRSRGHFHVIGF